MDSVILAEDLQDIIEFDMTVALSVTDTEASSKDVIPTMPTVPDEVALDLSVARRELEKCAQPVTVETVAAKLSYIYGPTMKVRETVGGASASERMFHPSHKYLVYQGQPGEELLIDINFKERFCLGKTTEQYQQRLSSLPIDFIGTQGTLRDVIQGISKAAAVAFAAHGMPVPPWRTLKSLMYLWGGPVRTEKSVVCYRSCNSQSGTSSPCSVLDSVLRFDIALSHGLGTCTQRFAAPAAVIVGFPSGRSLNPCTCLPIARPIPKPKTAQHVSQQLDYLLGPLHKVKIGRL